MNPAKLHDKNLHILYDADAITRVDAGLFDPVRLETQGRVTGKAPGRRGAAWFFKIDDDQFVLRHYRRGGRIAGLLDDRYLWTGLERTRAFREWRLLAALITRGLPVSAPVAARVIRRGLFYRADLITRAILDARSVADTLSRTKLSAAQWRAIGHCVGRLHRAGVRHADLNAHNILLDTGGRVHLIDFDNSALRPPDRRWQNRSLARLRRSLDKLKRERSPFNFSLADFEALLAGHDCAGQERKAR